MDSVDNKTLNKLCFRIIVVYTIDKGATKEEKTMERTPGGKSHQMIEHHTLFFFFMSILYKNIEAEIGQILRIF